MTNPYDQQQPGYGYPPPGSPAPQPGYPTSEQGYPPPPQAPPGYPAGYPGYAAPGYPAPQPGYPLAPPPKKTRWGLIIGIVAIVLLLACGGVVGCVAIVVKSAKDSVEAELNAEKTDITIIDCAVEDDRALPSVKVTWKVTNSGSISRTYAPTFVAESADGTRLGDGSDFVGGLQPGDTRTETSTILLDAPATGSVTCKLSD